VSKILGFKKQRQPEPWRRGRRRREHWLFRGTTRSSLTVLMALFGLHCMDQTSSVHDRFPGGRETRHGSRQGNRTSDVISCVGPHLLDGDTFTCAGVRIPLAGIDAPEMPGHCRAGRSCTPGDPVASRDYLRNLSGGQVTCRPIEIDRYGRTVALCEAGGKDLSCAMIAARHAVARYRAVSCGN
jgi:endonuclease YncB( thermonuclease family)